MKIAGLLLAGGRSRRFGSEKAVAPWGAGLMMDVPLAALRSVCEVVAVSARPGSGAEARADILGLPCLADSAGGAEGPLVGIQQGLLWAANEGSGWLAVAPCDSPTLASAHYEALIDALGEGAPAVIGVGDGGAEPLVSVWPVAAGAVAVSTALADGGHPAIRQVLEAMGAIPIRLGGYDGLNVNSPVDVPIAR